MLANKLLSLPVSYKILIGIFLLGLMLRLGWISNHGLWNDEVNSVETARSGLSFIFANHFGWMGNQTSWHYALIWLMSLPIDPASSPILVRLPSALAGALLSLFTYGIGRELFSRATGLFAAFLVACAPVLLDFSQDVRPYSLLAFLTAGAVYCMLKAQQTAKGAWWLGFTLFLVADLANTYMALTLVLPSLAPYFAWILWKTWKERREETKKHNPLFAISSFAVAGVVSVLLGLGLLQMQRVPPNWSKFSLISPVNVLQQLLTWFTGLGFNNAFGTLISQLFLVAAAVGLYVGFRQGKWRGVALCVLLSVMPSLILAVLATSSMTFQRYALFIGPFYFLLIGNALASALQAYPRQGSPRMWGKWVCRAGTVAAVLTCALFLLGVFNYINPTTHQNVSYRPDFRGAAAYLDVTASPQDVIILVDDPALGYNVTNFYWHYQPPAHLYDARDPLLYRQEVTGNVYWIFSSFDNDLTKEIAGASDSWSAVLSSENIVVLKETPRVREMDVIVGDMATKLDTLNPGFQPTETLKGGLLQAKGDLASAAQTYRDAGEYFPLGGEYLRTAEGFDGVGLGTQAWREGLVSKAMEPAQADVHRWLAGMLQTEGYTKEATQETQIAQLLDIPTPKASIESEDSSQH